MLALIALSVANARKGNEPGHYILNVYANEPWRRASRPRSMPRAIAHIGQRKDKQRLAKRGDQDQHPPMIPILGLAEALKAECEQISRNLSVRVDVEVDHVPEALPGDVALCVFRVAQRPCAMSCVTPRRECYCFSRPKGRRALACRKRQRDRFRHPGGAIAAKPRVREHWGAGETAGRRLGY
jgi:hypothetical protein